MKSHEILRSLCKYAIAVCTEKINNATQKEHTYVKQQIGIEVINIAAIPTLVKEDPSYVGVKICLYMLKINQRQCIADPISL